MDDETDAFARLKRLHTQGVLTDAEYERAKATLMASRSAVETSPSPEPEPETPRSSYDGWSSSNRWTLLAAVVLILLIGVYFFGKAASIAESRGELSAEPAAADASTEAPEGLASLFGPSDPWTYDKHTDPMTDATISRASATFEGQQFDIQVVVSCSSTGSITYTATSFDKDGQGAPMRVESNGPRGSSNRPAGSQSQSYSTPTVIPGYLSISYQIRADDSPAISSSDHNPAYNNQVTLLSEIFIQDLNRSVPVASASSVVLRLFMPSGEENFTWQQDSDDFKRFVQPCLSHQQAAAEREEESRAAREEEWSAKTERNRAESERREAEYQAEKSRDIAAVEAAAAERYRKDRAEPAEDDKRNREAAERWRSSLAARQRQGRAEAEAKAEAQRQSWAESRQRQSQAESRRYTAERDAEDERERARPY